MTQGVRCRLVAEGKEQLAGSLNLFEIATTQLNHAHAFAPHDGQNLFPPSALPHPLQKPPAIAADGAAGGEEAADPAAPVAGTRVTSCVTWL